MMGSMSAACGLDWAVADSPKNDDLRDASDETRFDPDGGLNGPPRTCSHDAPCGSDEYCDYADGLCGGGGEGICRARPGACTQTTPPQCGCDGKRYTMACEAHRAGVDDGADACAPNAPEYFACGTEQCRVGKEYCLVSGLLTARTYTCKPFSGCATANCACARTTNPCLSCIEVTGGGTLNDCSL